MLKIVQWNNCTFRASVSTAALEIGNKFQKSDFLLSNISFWIFLREHLQWEVLESHSHTVWVTQASRILKRWSMNTMLVVCGEQSAQANTRLETSASIKKRPVRTGCCFDTSFIDKTVRNSRVGAFRTFESKLWSRYFRVRNFESELSHRNSNTKPIKEELIMWTALI